MTRMRIELMAHTGLKGSAVAGANNPDDEAILYALSSAYYHVKGVLTNGPSADPIVAAIAQKLQKGLIMMDVQTTIQGGSA